MPKPPFEPLSPWYHEDDISPIPFNTAPFRWIALALYLSVFAVIVMISPIWSGWPLMGYGVFSVAALALYWNSERGFRDVAVLWACGIWIFAIMIFLPMWLDWTPGITGRSGSLFKEMLIPFINSTMILAMVYAVAGMILVRCNRWYHLIAMLAALFSMLCLWFLATMVITDTWL